MKTIRRSHENVELCTKRIIFYFDLIGTKKSLSIIEPSNEEFF